MANKASKSHIELLTQERDQVMAELTRLREDLKSGFELDDVDNVATDLVERDKTQTLIFALERKIESIDHAIAQAEEIGYGICEKCGNPIEPERLEIFPETTFCINCKRQTERSVIRH